MSKMFRMQFQTMDSVSVKDEDCNNGNDVNEAVYERYREGTDEDHFIHTPTVYEGRVGKFGKVARISGSNNVCDDAYFSSPARSRASSSNGVMASANSWKEADLMNFDAPSLQGVTQDEKSHQALFLDAQVLRDLVQAASESRLADERKDVETMSVSSQTPAALLSRTDSMVSTSSFNSDSSSDESGCSLAGLKIQRASPTEELLLAGIERVKLDNKLQEDMKDDVLTLEMAEEQERLRQHRELRDLANCTTQASPHGRSFQKTSTRKLLRKSGLRSLYRFIKYPFRIFRSHKDCPGYPSATHTVVQRKRGIFGGCFSSSDDTLAQMRSAPRQQTRPVMQFSTVQSTQRDVPAWTMEEYMAKNGRLQNWNRRKDDEEFGGIEGNNLMNQYADENVVSSYDSDSD